ncbi:alpha/beta hydrolase [Nitratireductor mangrovi]|uniref:Alpha/beta hydrolase n=1 Tax=Nitratireductor mangrovi TaxID=2599600 RepID=A0A5B8KX09_9HYPH|nr:alpha/beta hydrolase [Nitratireductor mangrovi]QDZ00135.1 alpha/beta hydrolase [Nitratireductor mangrovi]
MAFWRLGIFLPGQWACAVAALALSASVTAGSAAFDPLTGIRIEQAIAAGDVETAASLIETALESENDQRAIKDLLARKADLEAASGDHAAAAQTRLQLVAVIEADEGATAPSLVAPLRQAAEDLLAAGNQQEAVDLLARALAIIRSSALENAAEPILETLKSIAVAGEGTEAGETASETVKVHEESGRGFSPDGGQKFTEVKVYYATDRARSGSEDPNEFYGGQRGELEMGTAIVSIPDVHRPGQIEKPTWWTFQFREDPERHIVLHSVTPKSGDDVFAEMRAQTEEMESKEAFVFVHGFNVPFNEAAQRTAQMAHDMNFDGLPVLYSWPSRASVMSYIADTAVVNLSGRRLSHFLEDLVARSGATRIHLIAHSMGNRAMTDALELFALRYQGPRPAFDQVLFTAPDLDAGLFAEMMKTIRPVVNRITLYASNKDWALAVSRQLHGDAPRAGQGGRSILHTAEVDSIDMTEIGEDMLKHSYYANNPSALTDILSLFWRDAPPDKRCGMTRAEGEHGTYWQYSPNACGNDDVLLSTLSFLRHGSVGSFKEARQFFDYYLSSPNTDPEERSKVRQALSKLFGQ